MPKPASQTAPVRRPSNRERSRQYRELTSKQQQWCRYLRLNEGELHSMWETKKDYVAHSIFLNRRMVRRMATEPDFRQDLWNVTLDESLRLRFRREHWGLGPNARIYVHCDLELMPPPEGRANPELIKAWWPAVRAWRKLLRTWQGPWTRGELGNVGAKVERGRQEGRSNTELARMLNRIVLSELQDYHECRQGKNGAGVFGRRRALKILQRYAGNKILPRVICDVALEDLADGSLPEWARGSKAFVYPISPRDVLERLRYRSRI